MDNNYFLQFYTLFKLLLGNMIYNYRTFFEETYSSIDERKVIQLHHAINTLI